MTAIVLVDGHVHVHADTDLTLLLDSALANFAAAAAKEKATAWQGALLLTEMLDARWFEEIPVGGLNAGPWAIVRDGQDDLTLHARRGGQSLLIVAGRQVVTREGIEVLSLGTRTVVPDGLPLQQTLDTSHRVAAVTVLPWAVGKWLGERGRLVKAALDLQQPAVHGGDNGGRPWFWPSPPQWKGALARGAAVISGSDPLPLPGDERRVGSFGSWMRGPLDGAANARNLFAALKQRSVDGIHPFGAPQGTVQFFRNQVGLRLRGKSRKPGRSAGVAGTETPDIETASAGYARRFSGPAGRYLLDVQSRSIRDALRGMPPGKVLDVGGGHGQLVDLLRDMGWEVTVHGSSRACEENLRNLHGKTDCAFREGDIFHLPAADREFDLVIAVRLISHVEDWPRLVAELCRVARHAVVIDYPAKSALNVLTPLLFGLKKSLEGNTRTYTSFSSAQLGTEFAKHGFGPPGQVKQFFMPMVVHRVGKGAAPLRAAEAVFRALGLTALFGSPVIMRADRR